MKSKAGTPTYIADRLIEVAPPAPLERAAEAVDRISCWGDYNTVDKIMNAKFGGSGFCSE